MREGEGGWVKEGVGGCGRVRAGVDGRVQKKLRICVGKNQDLV